MYICLAVFAVNTTNNFVLFQAIILIQLLGWIFLPVFLASRVSAYNCRVTLTVIGHDWRAHFLLMMFAELCAVCTLVRFADSCALRSLP